MKHKLLPLYFLLLLVLEGTLVALLPASVMSSGNIFVPYFLLIFLLFMTAYYDSKAALFYAAGFGLLYDIIYLEIIGVYLFAFLVIVYLFSLLLKFFYDYLFIVGFLAVLAIAVVEYYGYGFMLLTQRTTMTHHTFFYHRFLPTVLLNLGVIIIFSYFLRKFFTRLKSKKEDM